MGSCQSADVTTNAHLAKARSDEAKHPRVTLHGKAVAKGKISLADGGPAPVKTFLGIPYAKPPVGKLRFCYPEPIQLWSGERDCTQYGGMPLQPVAMAKEAMDFYKFPCSDNFSEDCLYLNVFSPNTSPDARLPVMVWFYGGGFMTGTSDMYEGTALASYNDVIVVTVNYRLGLLGFFTTGDNNLTPGNLGLFDQAESLKWVKDNIAAFGGDPDNVTIFGESAGGMSTSLHVLSDVSKDLFRRAIIQSGPAISPYVISTPQKSMEHMKPFAEEHGYKGSTNEELVEFLRGQPAEVLGNITETMEFKPVIDGVFLKDYPYVLYKNGQYQKKEIMTGCNSHEGYMMAKYFLTEQDMVSSKESIVEMLKAGLGEAFKENTDTITDEAVKVYLNDNSVGNLELSKQQLTRCYGDMIFNGPNHVMSAMHSGGAPVYVYLFSHRIAFCTDEEWAFADHFIDIFTTFGMCFYNKQQTFSEKDKKVAKEMMAYLANFARNGNPNGSGLLQWPNFSKENKAYLIIKENCEEATDYNPESMAFVENEMPRLDTQNKYA